MPLEPNFRRERKEEVTIYIPAHISLIKLLGSRKTRWYNSTRRQKAQPIWFIRYEWKRLEWVWTGMERRSGNDIQSAVLILDGAV